MLNKPHKSLYGLKPLKFLSKNANIFNLKESHMLWTPTPPVLATLNKKENGT